MNLHVPQSYEAATELEEIAALKHHIVTPRHAKPLIGVFQDTLIGSYLLTKHGNRFTRREFMNLMTWNKRFDGRIPEPRDGNHYTGQQVLSALLPSINMDMGNKSYDADKDSKESANFVKIVEGDIKQGTMDDDIFMKPGKGVVHVVYNDHGPDETVKLLDSLQMTVESYLVMHGFSVGISDLVADDVTKTKIAEVILQKKKKVNEIVLQVHTDLFDNNTGKTNQQEFEDQVFSVLNQATDEAGKAGKKSLAADNRLVAMITAGSKGNTTNIAQMIACLGQQSIEGKRIPYGFTDRTLPHYKKYDDGAEARGFIESSFIRGLTPQEFFFHAMSGREGLIDTAVKSVTGDTEIVIIENGVTKHTKIGDWIDAHIDGSVPEDVEHFKEADMELLKLKTEVYVPTCDSVGNVTWGKMTAVTRHDPGDKLYEIKTQSGKEVIVTAGKSLLIWDEASESFKGVLTPTVKIGDCVPVTVNLPEPPVVNKSINITQYLPKTEYVHGTEFNIAKREMENAMSDRQKIPAGWWKANNGKLFTLPYPNKARFQRVNSGRSNVDHIKDGYIYPYRAVRNNILLPETFELNERNGIFIGLFLADGNADIPSGYVQITKNNDNVRNFVKSWFSDMGIKYKERSREIEIKTVDGTECKGTTKDVRGFSTLLGRFLDAFVGRDSDKKHVPDAAFTAPIEFVKGVLNGYISGDGCVDDSSVSATSTSHRLVEGITMLCSRLGIFGYEHKWQQKHNNIGTKNILPSYSLTVRSKWARIFANSISLVNDEKQTKLKVMTSSANHIHYPSKRDVVLDEIKEINEIDPAKYKKMYDVTVPSTLNFALANALNLVDTAETGYIQRQLVKAMEDLVVQHDGSVRDANFNMIQSHYGEDGINATKVEMQAIPLGKLSLTEIRREFGMELAADLSDVLKEGTVRADEAVVREALAKFVEEVLYDQKMLVEGVFQSRTLDASSVYSPVNIARLLLNTKVRFGINADEKTDLTPEHVLEGIRRVIERTHSYNRIWGALLRFHLAPHKLVVKERLTKDAFDAICEMAVVMHMKAWVQPGEQVGVVAAQSIGEPSTQMSSTKRTVVCIKKSSGENFYGTISDFVDAILIGNSQDVKQIGENSVILDLKDDFNIIGVSTDEKTSWRRISQISRHPANGGLVEVCTKSGRRTTATLTHSFLRRSPKGIVPVKGSKLKIGMRIPIARVIPEAPNASTSITQGGTVFRLTREFGWLCGSYIANGNITPNTTRISKIAPIVEERLSKISTEYGWTFSVRHHEGEYGPSKDNIIYNKDLSNFLEAQFKTGSYDKEIGGFVFTSNHEFIAGLIGGYFDGDGNCNAKRHQIRASSRSKKLIQQMTALLAHCGIFGTMGEETSVRMPGKVSYVLQIPKKFAKQFKEKIEFSLPEKAEPLDEIIAYMERSDKHDTKELYDKIPELGDVIAETGRLLRMPGQSRLYGRWINKESIGRLTLQQYIQEFKDMMKIHIDKEAVEQVNENMTILESAADADVVWDEIVELVYHDDPKEYVYDFTVPGNDSFMVDCNVLVHNTLNVFHYAGVASSSNVTRGVPRLRELLKVTKNMKATSLTIHMKPEYRQSKEKARELVQELELTLLRHITDKLAIYWDPSDNATIVEEDKKLISFFRTYERLLEEETGVIPSDDTPHSKWMLRLELNREKMFNKNISMADVVFIIKYQFTDVDVVYSDYNSDKLVMRIRLPNEAPTDTASKLDDYSVLKKFQNNLLNSTVVRGVPGIKAVTFKRDEQKVQLVDDKYVPVTQYILDTDGSNYVKVMNHPLVDANRLYTTNIHDVMNILGIEAVRAILHNEIATLFEGVGVNFRHLGILCDIITHTGKLMSIDRYGINKNDIGPLAKASFEETEKIVLKAALFGEVDPVTGVSANIMMGQPIRGGTAFSQIMLDEGMFASMTQGALDAVDEEEEKADLTDFVESRKVVDPCSSQAFQTSMNITSAPTFNIDDEEDIDIDIIDG